MLALSRERNYNIELLRVISCILVVCIHVSNVYSRGYGEVSGGTYLFSLLTNCFSRVAVPVFFMISGYLLLDENVSLRKSIHRVIHTIIVLVFWSVLYYFWNIAYWDDRYDFTAMFEDPVKKHLWFLYAILGMYIALPFFQLLFKKTSRRLMEYFCLLWGFFLTLYYVLALADMEFTYTVPMVGNSSYLGYFVMGYIMRNFSKDYKLGTKTCFGIVLIVGLINVALTCYGTVTTGDHEEIYFQYRNPLIAICSLGVFTGIIEHGRIAFTEAQKSIMQMISRHSFTIYLSHIIFLDIVKEELEPFDLPGWIGIPVYTIGIFLVTFAFAVAADNAWKHLRTHLPAWI